MTSTARQRQPAMRTVPPDTVLQPTPAAVRPGQSLGPRTQNGAQHTVKLHEAFPFGPCVTIISAERT
jgi:hypothetical protein